VTGTHVPHPGIAQSRVAALQVEMDRPTPVWLDGERIGAARSLAIRVEADALTCVV
jgi:diacylglycerol kinase family enzyme